MNDEKISLCCITGNCEGIIESFVERFHPIADEICIVRAIGNQKHDGTLRKALAAGCRVGEYFNRTHPEWEHVDDFGAARNVAWDMATHEWVMWADHDDIISPESIREFRRLVKESTDNVEMIRCPYVVPDQSIHQNLRERIVRRGKFKWFSPVHEFLVSIDGHKYEFIESRHAEIVHGAKSDRRPSCERNIRILESLPENERSAGTYFYLFSEYHGIGRKEDAVKIAHQFMKMKDAGESERYEVLLMLSAMAKSPEQIAALLHEAHRTSPTRAEALHELTNLELTFGNVDRARAYCRQMISLPKPTANIWNIRKKYYGWAAKDLEAQVDRYADLPARADAREFNRFKAAGGKISLLHATRGRPLQAVRARITWLEASTNPESIEHIFAIDADDMESQCLRRFRNVIVSGEHGCVEAWNVAAHAANGEIFIQVSDDWIPPSNWDAEIIKRIGPTNEPKVLAISDGNRKDDLLCMAILTRARWKKQDKILFHPDFTGVYSDNWFSRNAYQDGVVIDARDLTFVHCHPMFGTAQTDPIYERQNSEERYADGKRIFEQLGRADGRHIYTHCSVRLGDNLAHLQFLRKLARRYPRTRFIHAAHSHYLQQMRQVVADLSNIELTETVHEGSIEVWKNHEGFWINHPTKNDYCGFFVEFFNQLARKMDLENPIKKPEHFLFDYPALLQKTPLDGPFDFLIINSPPLSGQLRGYSDLSETAWQLKAHGYSVIVTHPVEGITCTQDAGLSVTAIGSLSRQCRFIIMVSTGPSWPTFNVWNQETIELRIIVLDNEKIEMAPNTVHVQNEQQVLEVLKQKGLL